MENERLDDLELNGLGIIQDTSAFCFGTDAVLLAAFCRAKGVSRVLDLGTGNGILPLLIWGRYAPQRITAVEIQPAMARLARRNMEANSIPSVDVVCGDFRDEELFEKNSYDLVVSNPPYQKLGSGDEPENEAQRIARCEVSADLKDVLSAAVRALIPGGRFCMVHRPQRLSEAFVEMAALKLEPKKLQLVQPRPTKAPNLFLIEGVYQGKPGLSIMPSLILADENGENTADFNKIYGK